MPFISSQGEPKSDVFVIFLRLIFLRRLISGPDGELHYLECGVTLIPMFRLLLLPLLLIPLLAGDLTRIANESLDFPVAAPPEGDYTFENAFTGVTFNRPVNLAVMPDENRYLFVVERNGILKRIELNTNTVTEYLDLNDLGVSLSQSSESGFLACAFHPDFKNDGRIFVFYSLRIGNRNRLYQRVAVIQASGTTGDFRDDVTIPVSSTTHTAMITQYDKAGNHNGGDLHFDNEGFLCISVGDEGSRNDFYDNGNRIDRDFFSAILRVDVDDRPDSLVPNSHEQDANITEPDSAITDGSYKIPAGNPFVDPDPNDGVTSFDHQGGSVSYATVRSEIWVSGLRNPFRFSFDRPTGRCFVADVGQGLYEEVNLVQGGEDCGWSRREGLHAFTNGPEGNQVPEGYSPHDPIHEYRHGSGSDQGLSITGGVVYRGSRLSELAGTYIFSDYVTGNVWSLREEEGTWTSTRIEGESRLVAFGADPRNGDLLACNITSGQVRRLVREEGVNDPPLLLSETGAFTDLSNLTPAAGIYAYEINQPFWSDYAKKKRWFAMPDLTSRINYSEQGRWNFPTGQVWIKHFDLERTRGDEETARKLETRFLIKTDEGSYGLTYRWRDDQSDAELVAAAGFEEDLTIKVDGVDRVQRWSFPSRESCLTCHVATENSALSFNTRQLNREGQIDDLACAGFLDATPAEATRLPKHPQIDNDAVSVEARVRAYLQVNCAMCHDGSGAGSSGDFDARITTMTDMAGLINGLASDNLGDSANRILIPGNEEHSILLTRLSEGEVRMPPVGSNEIDLEAVALLKEWINGDLVTRKSYAQWAADLGIGGKDEDADGDGQENYLEFLAGTNPVNSGDRFAIEISPSSVSVPVAANRSTLVEGSYDLLSWFPLPSPLNDTTPPAAAETRSLPIPGDPDEIFIRAVIREP